MYIYRAVRSRGKSLQKVLTTKKEYGHNIQLLAHQLTRTLRTQPLGWSSLQMPEDKDDSGLGCTSVPNWNSAFPGGKVSGSHTGSWPHKNLGFKG